MFALILNIFFTMAYIIIIRSSHQKCSAKRLFLKISQNSQKHTCTTGHSLKSGPETRDPGTRTWDWNWDPGTWDLKPWGMGS